MAKKLLFVLYLCCISLFVLAQNNNNNSISDTATWFETPLKFINASIKLPYKTTMDKKSIYTEKGLQTQYFFLAEHKALSLQFEVNLRQLINSKDAKNAIKEEIQRITIENGAYPTTNKGIDNFGRTYTSISIVTPDKKTTNYLIYILDDYLTTISGSYYGKNNYTAIFNYFFNSLKYNPSKLNNLNNKEKKVKTKSKYIIDWQSFVFDKFTCQFPNEPKHQKEVVATNGVTTTSYEVNSYYYQNKQNNVSYLVSNRQYNNKQNADSLIQTAFETLKQYTSAKTLEEKKSFLIQAINKEYVIKYNNVYYRVKYIYTNNSLFQLMIAGNKKSINKMENANFFEHFTVLP